MTPKEVSGFFTRSDGTFLFARWGRPIAPVVFGVREDTLSVVKGAVEAVVALAGHQMAETDPDIGANLMIFFVRDWSDLADTPNLDRLIPDFEGLLSRLRDADANQYRIFRFDASGAIMACFVFLRMDEHLSNVPAEDLALGQIVQSFLLWSDIAFDGTSPLVRAKAGATILRPQIAALIRAAYDPILPDAAHDPAHGLRLFARMGAVD